MNKAPNQLPFWIRIWLAQFVLGTALLPAILGDDSVELPLWWGIVALITSFAAFVSFRNGRFRFLICSVLAAGLLSLCLSYRNFTGSGGVAALIATAIFLALFVAVTAGWPTQSAGRKGEFEQPGLND